MERLISHSEGEQLNKYFNLFKGQEVRYGEIKRVSKPAVEVLIFDRKLVAQQMLWEKDEMIQPSKTIYQAELPDEEFVTP